MLTGYSFFYHQDNIATAQLDVFYSFLSLGYYQCGVSQCNRPNKPAVFKQKQNLNTVEASNSKGSELTTQENGKTLWLQ